MDIATISQLIGSLGFPIACCIVLFLQNNTMQKTLTELQKTLVEISTRLDQLNDTCSIKRGDE